jgi:hypothetical protein
LRDNRIAGATDGIPMPNGHSTSTTSSPMRAKIDNIDVAAPTTR